MSTARSRLARPRAAASLVLAAVATLTLAGCGDDSEPSSESTTTRTMAVAPTSTSTTEPATTATESSDASASATETVDPNAVVVDVTIVGTAVTVGEDRVAVTAGQTLTINVTSDVADELHVHGFDVEAALEPNQTATLEIAVDTTVKPGLYEVETHESGLLLFQIEVR